MPFLLFFIVLPIIEITLFIKAGQVMGVFNTLAILFMAGIGGIILLRWQGFTTLLKVNQRLQEGELPAQEIISGALLALGGLLLIIPGFFTDILALFCLLPPTRFLMVKHILKKGTFVGDIGRRGSFFQYTSRSDGREDIIEDEFSRDHRGQEQQKHLEKD